MNKGSKLNHPKHEPLEENDEYFSTIQPKQGKAKASGEFYKKSSDEEGTGIGGVLSSRS